MDKEIKSLTGIRGIAALWVVFFHYFETTKNNKDLYISKVLLNGYISVDMFFLLSAFVMCLAYADEFKGTIPFNSYSTFMKKRFIRIYPAYFFWAFMILCFELIKLNFNFTKILLNLGLIQNLFNDAVISSVFWSLSAEWILYLIFPFLYAILQKTKGIFMKIFLIIISIIGIYLLPSFNNYIIDFFEGLIVIDPSGGIEVTIGINSIVRCFFSYVIGINLFLLIKNYDIINYLWPQFLKYFTLIMILVILSFGRSVETYALLLICSILLIASLFLGKAKQEPFFSSKIVYFLGKISYSIYLCHMFILVFISILVKKLYPLQYDSSLQPYLVMLSLILLIPISYLSYNVIEIKAGSWLKSKLFAKSSEKG